MTNFQNEFEKLMQTMGLGGLEDFVLNSIKEIEQEIAENKNIDNIFLRKYQGFDEYIIVPSFECEIFSHEDFYEVQKAFNRMTPQELMLNPQFMERVNILNNNFQITLVK